MKHISTRLIAWFLLVSIVPLALVAVLAQSNAERTLHAEIEKQLRIVADVTARQIHTFYRERVKDISTLAQSPAVIEALDGLGAALREGDARSPKYLAIEREVRPFLLKYQEQKGYSDLLFISEERLVFAVNSSASLGTNVARLASKNSGLAKIADRAATLLEPSLSNFQFDSATNEHAAYLAAPVMKAKTVVGVVALQISNREICRLVEDYTALGETGETIIGQQEGDKVVFVAPTRHDREAAFRRRIALGSSHSVPMQNAVQGRHGQGVLTDYRGQRVLAAWRYVPAFRWGMVVKIDVEEVLAPVRQLRRQAAMIGILAALAAGFLALAVSKTISQPIVQLQRSAKMITGGHYEERVHVDAVDEIGELADSFNDMAQQIAASHASLERRVEERTGELQAEIARHVETQAELRTAIDLAESANRAKSEFLANMSHEIRTPMNGIIGMAELLRHTPLSAEQNEYLGMVQQSADSLLRLLNDILDFSKIEAGKLDLETIEFSLRDCIGKTGKTLGVRAAEKDLELACRVAPELPDRLLGDPGRLRQILVNLVGNAIKFTEQGEVVVEVCPASRTDEEVELHFSVTDTGIGIPADKRASVFGAFMQADASTTRKFGGTGLGLAISSQLVRLMGGRIWLESEVGRGTAFHFTITLREANEQDAREPLREDSLADLRVLIVDDNATNRRILYEMLRNFQLRPAVAESGPTALAEMKLAVAAGDPYPLVILDCTMPEMDGFMLAEQIRGHADFGKPTMIMISSAARAGEIDKCREMGISRYMTKPIVQSELLAAILEVVGDEKRAEIPSCVPPRDLPAGRRLKILLAEDGLVNQRVAVGLLERVGHQVVVAANGKAAVEAWAKEDFDLVLMDIQMPEMDGYEATTAIRAREKATQRHIPIIATTAAAMKGDREECFAVGMDGYLAKPLNPAQLYQAIEELAPRNSPPAESPT